MPYNPNGGGGFGGGGLGGQGSTQWGHDLENRWGWTPDSPNRDWIDNFEPNAAGWQGGFGGGAPGRLGQELMWNSRTGEESWVNRPGLDINGQSFAGWDPVTGNQFVNMDQMGFGGGGAGGGGGYQNYQMSDYGGGNVTPGEGYQGFDYDSIGSGIDPSAVIAAQEYKLQEAMEGDMARAGGRAGASGFAMSTPYANQLGEAARSASNDRNALTMQYQYDAAQAQAQRDLAQQQQAAQLDFGGWQTGYQGDLQSQMFNSGQGFDQWALQNQFGMQDNQGQNYWNQQQQNQQQQMLMGLLGGMF